MCFLSYFSPGTLCLSGCLPSPSVPGRDTPDVSGKGAQQPEEATEQRPHCGSTPGALMGGLGEEEVPGDVGALRRSLESKQK